MWFVAVIAGNHLQVNSSSNKIYYGSVEPILEK